MRAMRWATSLLAVVMLTGCTHLGSAGTGGRSAQPDGTAASADATAQPVPDTAVAATWWRPRTGLTWQIQYSGALDATVPVQVYDVDAEDTSKAQVAALKARGVRTICYVNAGAFENWRPDRGAFPAVVLGRPLQGWPGERWLDIRRRDLLLPILTARMDTCRAKGFDAVDPDNLDGYTNASGFPLTRADTVAYVRALATAAHRRGLAIGLKNATETIPQLVAAVDFAVNEECEQYRECGAYRPFLNAGKAVFHIEYRGTVAAICARRPKGFSTLSKPMNLGPARSACPV